MEEQIIELKKEISNLREKIERLERLTDFNLIEPIDAFKPEIKLGNPADNK